MEPGDKRLYKKDLEAGKPSGAFTSTNVHAPLIHPPPTSKRSSTAIVKDVEHTCPICGKTLSSKQSLQRHMANENVHAPPIHPPPTGEHSSTAIVKDVEHTCLICGKTLSSKQSLQRHMANENVHRKLLTSTSKHRDNSHISPAVIQVRFVGEFNMLIHTQTIDNLANASFLMYNIATGSTRTLSKMTTYRVEYGMTSFVNDSSDNVLVCGGYTTNSVPLSTCTLYNTATNVWSAFASMPDVLYDFTMITLNGNPFVCGGNRPFAVDAVYSFNASVEAWSVQAHMPLALAYHSAVAWSSGLNIDNQNSPNTAFVCGGKDANYSTQSACYTYSSTDDTWTGLGISPLNTPRAYHGMCVYKGIEHSRLLAVLWVQGVFRRKIQPVSTSITPECK
ncbi:unnamed protein product [Sphagnum balticum]